MALAFKVAEESLGIPVSFVNCPVTDSSACSRSQTCATSTSPTSAPS